MTRSLAWSPDGTLLASAGTDASVHLWDTATGACQMRYDGHTGRVSTVCFHPEGKFMASTSYDGSLQAWNIQTGKLLFVDTIPGPQVFHRWPHERRVICLPDGMLLFQNEHRQLVRMHPGTGLRTSLLDLAPYLAQDLACSADGKYLALRLRDFTEWEEEMERVVIWSLERLISCQMP